MTQKPIQRRGADLTKDQIGLGYDKIAEKVFVSENFYNECLDVVKDWRGKILEVGVGQGVVLARIQKRGGARLEKLYGIDLSWKLIRIAKDNVPEAEISYGDAEQLGFEHDFFDLVVMIDTFQYLQNFKQALDETRRVLKRGGRFLVTVPNKDWLLFDVYLKRRKNIQPVEDYFFTYDEIKHMLESSGFRVLKYKGVDALRFYGWQHKIFDRLAALIFRRLNKRMKKIIFLCEKT